ncbi:DUF5078 domain-containing protein [Mycolicibacter arupensis]|uniref:DUF5078 domain-containing protein n=1 Tax=Mycolicibacter arupensis TaxID=342002 RepID=A0A5C7XSA5_9MYCO|nr:MAG: DUF5078 domain-containing protein [Mycolicibacter arupensis]
MSQSGRCLAGVGAAALLTLGVVGAWLSPAAAADSTDDYPIPRRIIATTCTAEQLLAAARDHTPVYYERYIIDMHNHSPEVQRAAQDEIHRFFAMAPAQRRATSEDWATHLADPLTASWPNWGKLFFNNKGVVAKTAQSCGQYPPDDDSVWG